MQFMEDAAGHKANGTLTHGQQLTEKLFRRQSNSTGLAGHFVSDNFGDN